MDASKPRAISEGRNAEGKAEIRNATPLGDDCFMAEVAIQGRSESETEPAPAVGALRADLIATEPDAGKDTQSNGPTAATKSSVAASKRDKNLSRQIMLAAGRSTTVKKRHVTPKKSASGFASPFPGVMPIASDVPGEPRAFPREAIPALRLHFQSSRAEYVERRMNSHNAGVVELYCKLCLRLIVASRDEFVFPIAVKAHKCGRDLRSRMGKWGGFEL